MNGPDSWEGRPRDYPTRRVSELPPELRRLFKQLVGKRRWTTEAEVQRLADLQKYGRMKP